MLPGERMVKRYVEIIQEIVIRKPTPRNDTFTTTSAKRVSQVGNVIVQTRPERGQKQRDKSSCVGKAEC